MSKKTMEKLGSLD